jgi:hypothetical protein
MAIYIFNDRERLSGETVCGVRSSRVHSHVFVHLSTHRHVCMQNAYTHTHMLEIAHVCSYMFAYLNRFMRRVFQAVIFQLLKRRRSTIGRSSGLQCALRKGLNTESGGSPVRHHGFWKVSSPNYRSNVESLSPSDALISNRYAKAMANRTCLPISALHAAIRLQAVGGRRPDRTQLPRPSISHNASLKRFHTSSRVSLAAAPSTIWCVSLHTYTPDSTLDSHTHTRPDVCPRALSLAR